jgi:hypothetical protein
LNQIAVVALFAMLQAPALPVRTIARGSRSDVTARAELVVRTSGTWRLVWARHEGGGTAPFVDFDRDMVIAVFAGSRSVSDGAVDVLSVAREGRTLVVRYRENHPAADGAGAHAGSAPFHFVAVPRTRGPVRFIEVRELRSASPQ